MHCFYHPRRPAVAQCPDCGKGLCQRCASKYNIPICPECNNQRRKKERKTYLMPLIICAILFVVGCAVGCSSETPLLIGYLCMSLYGGWSAVGMLFSHIFVLLDLRSIAIYYLVRVILSILVGVVATPIYLGYCIYKLIRLSTK